MNLADFNQPEPDKPFDDARMLHLERSSSALAKGIEDAYMAMLSRGQLPSFGWGLAITPHHSTENGIITTSWKLTPVAPGAPAPAGAKFVMRRSPGAPPSSTSGPPA